MHTAAIQQIELIGHKVDTLLHYVMVDQRIYLQLSGFEPGQPVTVEAVYTPDNEVWRAWATFLTDDNGCVEVATRTPLSGSYREVDAMGLFWSMKKDVGAQSPGNNHIKLTATQGQQIRASTTIHRVLVAPGVRKIVVREQGLYGTLFLPQGEGPPPGLLVLGGSSGGLPSFAAQMFASHGYAALALAYFRYEDLPTELQSIPLEYFETALQWMQAQKSIQEDQIGVYGISKGGELALLLGANFSQIRAVIGVVPSAVVFQGISDGWAKSHSSWSLHGQDLPYVSYSALDKFSQIIQQAIQEQTPVALTTLYTQSLEYADAETIDRAVIRVENTRGPILLVSGQDDQMWPSSKMADMVIERLGQHRHPYPFKHLKYRGAGHNITFPYQPTTSNSTNIGRLQWTFGGNAFSRAAAERYAWSQILDFLAQSLPRNMAG